MNEYRYDLIEHAKCKVKSYYDDLETLLAWLLAYGVLDDMDGGNGFKPLSKDVYEWEWGDRSIKLMDYETEAFKRLGLIREETK